MANSNQSIITRKLSGSLGKQLVFREWDGKTIVSKAPKRRKRRRTAGQLRSQDKFRVATKYARAIANGADQGLKDAYSAVLRPRQNVYSRALEDFMSSPVVQSIDSTRYAGKNGDAIIIRAVDDFRVVSVEVAIYSSSGVVVEKGIATQQINGIEWIYNAGQPNETMAGTRIKAVARDVPANEGVLEITL